MNNLRYKDGKEIKKGDRVFFNYDDDIWGGIQFGVVTEIYKQYGNMDVSFDKYVIFDTFYPEQLNFVNRAKRPPKCCSACGKEMRRRWAWEKLGSKVICMDCGHSNWTFDSKGNAYHYPEKLAKQTFERDFNLMLCLG
ncbi:MAG TPA: hypothetical protein VLK33_05110 [Terriglobales bacterium]|nr:hypothetical protein [Terriglobales bacterium]